MTKSRWTIIAGIAGAVVVAAVAVALVLRAQGSPASGWQEPDPLPARSHMVAAVAADGSALAAWAERRDGQYVMRFAERPPGGSWSDGVDIGAPRHWQMTPTRLEVNERGDAVVVFSLSVRGVSAQQASFRPAGGTWEAPQTVTPVARDLAAMAVGIDGHGAVTVAYTRVGRGRGDVKVVRRTPSGWVAPSTIRSTSTGGAAYGAILAVATGDDGRAYVATATIGARDARPRIAVIERNGDHRPLPSPPVTNLAGSRLALAVNASGRPVIVWGQAGPGNTASVRTATLGADGSWSSARAIDRGIAGAPGGLTAVNTGAGLLVAWTQWQTPWTEVSLRASLTEGDESPAAATTVDTYEMFDMRAGAGGGSAAQALPLGEAPAHLVAGRFGPRYLMWLRPGGDPSGTGGAIASSSAHAGVWTDPEIVTPSTAWPLAVGATGPEAAQAVWQRQGPRTMPAMAADFRR